MIKISLVQQEATSQTATYCLLGARQLGYKTVHTLRFERLLNFVFTQPAVQQHKEKSSPAIWKEDMKQ